MSTKKYGKHKSTPMVMRLPLPFSLERLQQETVALLSKPKEERRRVDNDSTFAALDAGKEGVYSVFSNDGIDMQGLNGDRFEYNVASFYEMNDRAQEWIKEHGGHKRVISPIQRYRGYMNPWVSEFWDPGLDERVFDKPTENNVGIFKEFDDWFKEKGYSTRRNALVRVMGHQFLSPHVDTGPDMIIRIQIPVITNDKCTMGFRNSKTDPWSVFHLEPGYMYAVNSGLEHFARNDGDDERIQFRICVQEFNVLEDLGFEEYTKCEIWQDWRKPDDGV